MVAETRLPDVNLDDRRYLIDGKRFLGLGIVVCRRRIHVGMFTHCVAFFLGGCLVVCCRGLLLLLAHIRVE